MTERVRILAELPLCAVPDTDDEPPELTFYCLTCAKREFGGD